MFHEVDLTGAIYFTKALQYAQEAWERWVRETTEGISFWFNKGYGFPIVHAAAQYKIPLTLGDKIIMQLTVQAIGEKSFTLRTEMLLDKSKEVAAEVVLTHAFVKQGENKSSGLPEDVKNMLMQCNGYS